MFASPPDSQHTLVRGTHPQPPINKRANKTAQLSLVSNTISTRPHPYAVPRDAYNENAYFITKKLSLKISLAAANAPTCLLFAQSVKVCKKILIFGSVSGERRNQS